MTQACMGSCIKAVTGFELEGGEETYDVSPEIYKPYVEKVIAKTAEQVRNGDFRNIKDQDKYRQWFGGNWHNLSQAEMDIAIRESGGYEAFLKDVYLQGYDEVQQKAGERKYLIPEVDRLKRLEQEEGGVGMIDNLQNYLSQPANLTLIAGETIATAWNPAGWAYKSARAAAWLSKNAWKARGINAAIMGWKGCGCGRSCRNIQN